MSIRTPQETESGNCGILIRGNYEFADSQSCAEILNLLEVDRLIPHIAVEFGSDVHGTYVRLYLQSVLAWIATPGFDTLDIGRLLNAHFAELNAPISYEIVLTMLASPIPVDFPSLNELHSAIRIRRDIVYIAGRACLAFETQTATRPMEHWRYDEDVGFTIRPNVSLATALSSALYLDADSVVHAFSCYRATEYVMLLALAHELQVHNPVLHQELQTILTCRPIKSGEFHDVFLQEHGSMERPLPSKYFVPGDRVWFRNPDPASADIAGFEGSWVFYLGNGLFSNFWKRNKPFTFTAKCIEIFHWRNAIRALDDGTLCIDESRVDSLVEATLNDSNEVAAILKVMERYREPRGVYTSEGGCLDITRESCKWVWPQTSNISLPKARLTERH